MQIAAPMGLGASSLRPDAATVRDPFDPGVPVVAPLVGLTVISWATVAVSPWLMHWPLLLIALNPRMVFLLLVAPKLGLTEFTVVATLRLGLADPCRLCSRGRARCGSRPWRSE